MRKTLGSRVYARGDGEGATNCETHGSVDGGCGWGLSTSSTDTLLTLAVSGANHRRTVTSGASSDKSTTLPSPTPVAPGPSSVLCLFPPSSLKTRISPTSLRRRRRTTQTVDPSGQVSGPSTFVVCT